jgi:putative PIN family toxin of toxin-antitoxin system
VPKDAAVVDSTVWISALQFGGIPRRALDVATERQLLVCSDRIRAEIERNLVSKFGWDAARVRAEMFGYFGDTTDVMTPGLLRGVCRDPKDDAILECAVLAKATVIISGDRDLRVLHPYAGIEILSPREYIDRWNATEPLLVSRPTRTR